MFVGGLAILAEILDAFEIKSDARRGRRAARRIAVRPRRPLHRRRCSRAQRARDAGALSRRCGAVGAGRSDSAGFPAADARASGSWTSRSRSWCCRGPRGCTRSGWTSRIRTIRSTAPICSSMRTCRDSRRKSSGSSPRIVGAHRRKVNVEALQDLTPPWHIKAEYLIVMLRLAVLLHRGRSATALPKIELQPKGRSLEIVISARAGSTRTR